MVMVMVMSAGAGDAQDADAHSRCIDVQEFLHHHGNVSVDAVLCVHWCHLVRLCQVWRGPRQVTVSH